MSEASILDCEDCIEPAEAFGVIANETRLSILEALWESSNRPVAFSDLRKRVGMRDSAQFNYHLKQLTDHFLVQTDEGYDFRHAGQKVVRAIFAGSFNEHPQLDPFETDSNCTDCGATLEASYEDEQISISCTECGSLHGRYPFPPGGLKNRTEAEVLQAFNQRVRHLHCLAKDGVCPECNGQMSTTITRDTESYLGLDIRVDHECKQCRHQMRSAAGLSLLDQSDVVSFHGDHGINLGVKPYWDLDWCVSDQHTTVLDDDPWSIRIDIVLDDEELRITLDDDLGIVEMERQAVNSSENTKSVA